MRLHRLLSGLSGLSEEKERGKHKRKKEQNEKGGTQSLERNIHDLNDRCRNGIRSLPRAMVAPRVGSEENLRKVPSL